MARAPGAVENTDGASEGPPRARRRASAPAPWLLFVDTNILLDFYRLGGESAERQLKALQKHRGSLILTNQVWMEFIKNRQKVIAKTLVDFKKPDRIALPPILHGMQPAATLTTQLEAAAKTHGKVTQKIEAILRDPGNNDPVFKALKKLFEGDDRYAISRDHPDRMKIRSLARKRHVLGYPPRKDSDISVGDAVNWEWIIHCATKCDPTPNVMIVSRDGDYGVTVKNDSFVNDWLKKEFGERVNRRRKVQLTQKLTSALKVLSETITPEDEREEQKLIEENSLLRADHIMPKLSLSPEQRAKAESNYSLLVEFLNTGYKKPIPI